MGHFEKTSESELIFEGRILTLKKDTVILENGAIATREVVEHDGGVTVVPVTDDGDIILVSQYRYPYKSELLETPAGKLNKGEDPFECGKRELKEETGAVANRYIDLGTMYPSPGYCSETIYMYLATGLSFEEQKLDEDEFLSVVKLPFKKAVDMVLNGEISDAKTQIAILKAYFIIRSGKI